MSSLASQELTESDFEALSPSSISQAEAIDIGTVLAFIDAQTKSRKPLQNWEKKSFELAYKIAIETHVEATNHVRNHVPSCLHVPG